MEYITKMFILFMIIFTITGCGNNGNSNNESSNDQSGHGSVSRGNSVDKAMSEQMSRADPASSDAEMDYSEPEETQTADNVDYDLSAMSSDMVYAMVFQMMTDPDTYEGKTFRMSGLYYSVYNEPTDKYYHYCIIQDALACCAQGMEFLCDDGIHISPDDYPEENAAIVVQGVFETYQEEGDGNLYCRLKDAGIKRETEHGLP